NTCRRFPYVFKLYVITAASNGKDQLDIVRTDMYFRKFYKDKDIRVYGFANDEVSAIELVKTITEECVNKTGEANLREYLKCLE
ncbi:MAG: hypothetical protein J6033_07315, partial [Lachnospiraceae bacterium]|nr:hypothetical protein [Lachnospiraceae bacterium]